MVLIQSCPSESAVRAIFTGINIWHMITGFVLSSTAFVMLLVLGTTKLDDPRRKSLAVFISSGIMMVIQTLVSAYLTYKSFMGEPCFFSFWTTFSLICLEVMKMHLIPVILHNMQQNGSPLPETFARSIDIFLSTFSVVVKKGYFKPQEENTVDEQELDSPTCSDTGREEDDS